MTGLADDHHMPSVEAMLAGTLALMTGYSQFLQAAMNPAHRVSMGEKITRNLALLAEHPLLSDDCRCVLSSLSRHWEVMASCTLEAGGAMPPDDAVTLRAPTTLQ
jgi:hypothetical protein